MGLAPLWTENHQSIAKKNRKLKFRLRSRWGGGGRGRGEGPMRAEIRIHSRWNVPSAEHCKQVPPWQPHAATTQKLHQIPLITSNYSPLLNTCQKRNWLDFRKNTCARTPARTHTCKHTRKHARTCTHLRVKTSQWVSHNGGVLFIWKSPNTKKSLYVYYVIIVCVCVCVCVCMCVC